MGVVRNLDLYSDKINAPTKVLALSDLHKKLGSTYIVKEIKKDAN